MKSLPYILIAVALSAFYLVMMRRIYGNPGDWMIWIDLEIKETDSLRVLCFLAYDNSQIDI